MSSDANQLHDTIFSLLCAFSGADPEDHEESVFEADAADSLMSAIDALRQQELSELALRILDLPTAGVIDKNGIRRERLDRDQVLATIEGLKGGV